MIEPMVNERLDQARTVGIEWPMAVRTVVAGLTNTEKADPEIQDKVRRLHIRMEAGRH